MASIFTYEPDTPRVASPWLKVDTLDVQPSTSYNERASSSTSSKVLVDSPEGRPVRLQAEPQEGPVEYKLHLLLRPRRKFRSTSTGSHVTGSRHTRTMSGSHVRGMSESVVESCGSATPSAATQHIRQHRLEQLTTQLLWRLQQSSPHHSSSASNIILPSLPEALPELQAPQQPARLLHGLEESQGALYEIGVTDNGTLVGLADDELQESLNNLRAMAACLGCTVEVLRKEVVGDCEWVEDGIVGGKEGKLRRVGKLYVAEALVQPFLQTKSPLLSAKDRTQILAALDLPTAPTAAQSATEQLRITLTGPTMCGKSTLLGTLTTSTLDNGRGKSRLSMLKHRHEITSGITSSVTQELLGYQDVDKGTVEVVNYATENVASWIDVHAASCASRLVFICDSAGHPRYRRTTVRGLIGWAPHWTLLCIPADDTENSTGEANSSGAGQQTAGVKAPEADLSGAQLELCLRLGLPLIVVITKLDVASRTGLKATLTKVLDALKATGRKPAILPNKPGAVLEAELHLIDNATIDQAYNNAIPLLNDPVATVPIVLTSTVEGTGIRTLHALLHELPIPRMMAADSSSAANVFHIEDVYTKPTEVEGIIVSGRLRLGKINIGDTVALGPFSTHDLQEDSEDSDERSNGRPAHSHLPTSRSFPGALRDLPLIPPHFQLPGQEWKRVKVTSIRNLRLPVGSLFADQVGTIVIVPEDEAKSRLQPPAGALARIRKGMVLAGVQPISTRTFVAKFSRDDLESLAIGNHVVVYIASVRASAKIVSARAPDSPDSWRHNPQDNHHADESDHFTFDNEADPVSSTTNNNDGSSEKISVAGAITAQNLLVTLSFDSSREFVLVGDKVLVMPGGGPVLYGGQQRGQKGVAGLDGFVGTIVEVYG